MMLRAMLLAAGLVLAPLGAAAAESGVTHFPASPLPSGASAPYSAAVKAGDTLYVAGITDRGGATPTESAQRVMESIKRSVEAGGLTMDDLVWVQVFSSNLADYDAFNTVYRTYFKGPMPARAYLGVDHLLGNARFEVMGIAVRRAK
jgi:2-iminobutanoate/2-iminopropanoate deaminase